MLAGFNEDIVVEGTTYHVQSEDRGVSNPLLETLIYAGGRILDQVRSSYEHMIDNGSVDARELTAVLERQHKDILRRVRHGEFAPEGQRTLSDLMPVSTTFAEDLAELLETDDGFDLLSVVWKPARLTKGIRGRIHVLSYPDETPVEGALVSMDATDKDGASLRLFEGETGVDGAVVVELERSWTGLQSMIVRAERGPGGGRVRVPLAAPRAAVRAAEPVASVSDGS